MTGSADSSATNPTPFQEKLIAILTEEFGKRNVIVESDYDMTVYNRGRAVKVTTGNDFAVFYSCLTTSDDDIFTIPMDQVSDYVEILADLPWFQPALYRTISKKNYVPHYPICIYSGDIENVEGIVMIVNNLSSMAGFSSDVLNMRMSEIQAHDAASSDDADAGGERIDEELEDEIVRSSERY